MASIIDEPPAGTVSISSSITDEKPDVFVHGAIDDTGPEETAGEAEAD